MKIRTNLTDATIARYNAMNWNHGEDIYCLAPCGDCWMEILREQYNEDPEFLVDAEMLRSDTEWQIEKHQTMIDQDEAGHCHAWYLEGDRDRRTMEGVKLWRKYNREIVEYRRALKKWLASVETCEPRWIDTDDIEIRFDKRSGKAIA